MVRVLFLVAPFKAHMIRKMAEHFSSEIVWELITPSYPYTIQVGRQMSVREKILARLLPTSDKSTTETMSAFAPDVVYSDNPFYGMQFKTYSYICRRRLPLILHMRGDWWREYWGWFGSASWKQRALSSQIYTYQWISTLLASKITPICKWLECIVKHHVPLKRTEVVYQGVASEEFKPEPGFDLQHPSAAIIQNHTVYAKVAGLLNFAEVIERLPSIQFYIAEGENVKQSFLPLVKDRFARFPNAHFVKGIDNALAVRRILTAADCYVLASGLDCCPTTVLEASLMCKPIIASRIGGVPEIVAQGKSGWSIDNSRVDDWVEKIRLVTTDSDLNKRLGNYGRRWVCQAFGWEVIAKQVEHLLHAEVASR